MKQNKDINVNGMLIHPAAKNKTNGAWTLRCAFTFKGEPFFTGLLQLQLLLRTNVAVSLSKKILEESVHLLPRRAPPPASLEWLTLACFQKLGNGECPWHTGYERGKEKPAKTRGISGGSEAGCSISPSFKKLLPNTAQAWTRVPGQEQWE